jgi:hypothetical protein
MQAPAPEPLPFQGPPPGQVVDADFQVMVSSAMANIAPKAPAHYVPMGKPGLDDILAEAREQKELHARRVRNQHWMDRRLGMEFSAIFGADKQYVDLKEIEPQASQLLNRMFAAIVNFVADQTVRFLPLAYGMVNRDENHAIVCHLDETVRDWKMRHMREGQGDLLRTLTADALSGMVAIYHAPDPGNKRCGQRIYRVDPKVVFPIFGRDGLERVYVMYDALYTEVMRDYGDGVDPQTQAPNPATARIQKIGRSGKGRGHHRIDMETTREFVGFWDREYYHLAWGGQTIAEGRHGLYVCPWHVGVPNWRQTAGAKTSSHDSMEGNRPGPLIDVDGVSTPYELSGMGGGNRGANLARMYEPFLMPWVTTVDKLEKGETRLAYGVDRALDEALVWKRSSSNSSQGTPEIQNYRRGVTELEEDEELDKLPLPPLNESFEPWWAMMQLELQAAIPSVILQGQNVGTQASGNSLDTIREMGLEIFSPVPAFMQMLFADIGHRDLSYVRDWNLAYGEDDPGLAVPGTGGYGRDPQKLTREMLDRAECYVDCKFNRFTLGGAATMATVVDILNRNGIGHRVWYTGELGITTNPQQMEDERTMQNLQDTPEFAEANALVILKREMDRAAALEDDQSLLETGTITKRVASNQQLRDLQRAMMVKSLLPEQAFPGTGVEGPSEFQGQPGDSSANVAPMLSAPEVGRSTGTEGGAPASAPALPGQ